jgi:hypothetical protein
MKESSDVVATVEVPPLPPQPPPPPPDDGARGGVAGENNRSKDVMDIENEGFGDDSWQSSVASTPRSGSGASTNLIGGKLL